MEQDGFSYEFAKVQRYVIQFSIKKIVWIVLVWLVCLSPVNVVLSVSKLLIILKVKACDWLYIKSKSLVL